MKKAVEQYWIIIILLFFEACANIVTPSGGPKDVTPPVVIKTTPANNSVHFKERSIKIDFDEFVKIANASTQIVFSPFMKETPEVKTKGKSIVVAFNDTLKPNTTYTISFGKAIIDNNEGNVLLNYRYAFSTGDFIDTLTLKGNVKNALTLKPETGALVMLYEENYDSVPFKKTPFYISKSDEQGNFYFSNLKQGKFKIIALKDANNNYLYDPHAEMIAFRDSLVSPEPIDTAKADSLKKANSYGLLLFEEHAATQKLLKATSLKYGKLMLVFRIPVEDFSIKSLSDSIPTSSILQEFSSTKDTITLWMKQPDVDSVVLQVNANNKTDTSVIKLAKKAGKQTRGKGEEVKTTGLITNINASGNIDFFRSFTIESSTPLGKYDFSKIIIRENKDTIKAKFDFTDTVKRKMRFDYKLKEETTYFVFIPPGTLHDIFGLPNDTLKATFTTTSLKAYGNIKLKLKSPSLQCKLIVQLVTENETLIQEQIAQPNDVLDFIHVTPGTYRIKIICDANNNKVWDTGDYLKHLQPEKIFYYPSSITVKPNWDMDLDWEISR